MRRYFPEGGVCYDRIYDAAHLSRNRGQRVERVSILQPFPGTSGPFGLGLIFKFKGRPPTYLNIPATCTQQGGTILLCPDPDIAFTLAPNDARSLKLTMGKVNRKLSPDLGRPEDRVFILHQTNASDCPRRLE